MTDFKKDSNLKAAGAYEEQEKWEKWNNRTIGLTILVGVVLLINLWPLSKIVYEGLFGTSDPFSQRVSDAGRYYAHLFWAVTGQINPVQFLDQYFLQWARAELARASNVPIPWILWLCVTGTVYLVGSQLNPHRKSPNVFGDTRWANDKDIEDMAKRDLVGFDKDLFVVGKWKDKLLKMGETLSVLLLAPPGTGKSVGFIVPSIVNMDDSCLFVHDQKPELFDMTSRHRAGLGPVFQLKWSAEDQPSGKYLTQEEEHLTSPELLERDAAGEVVRHPSTGEAKTKPIYYPSWNPLSPKSIPGPGPRRDMYVERLVNVLAPDPAQGDKFWTSKARAALIGLIHFLVAKVEAANAPELASATSWSGIPEQWRGREASLPMLVDWFAYAQSDHEDPESEDPMRAFFNAAIDEAKELDRAYAEKRGVRPMNRAIVELTALKGSPDRTRGSIITTMDEALTPFKNEAVRQRTAASDFAFNELRGRPKKAAWEREQKKVEEAREKGEVYKPRYKKDEWEPISIYISVAMEDAKAMATITGVFVDAANSYLVANGPNAIDDQGNQLGPYAFGFLLDEAPQLPKLDTVINGPAVGRSKKISYVIVGQDFGQFEQKYSKPEVETLKSTTAIKVILTQNNESTAKSISEMSGKITYTKYSYSDRDKKTPLKLDGVLGDMFKIKRKSESSSLESTEFLKPSFLMSLPEGKHVVLVQNFMSRPIFCQTPKFFLDKEISKKVYNLRDFTGPAPTEPMPFELMDVAAARTKALKEGEAKAAESAPSAGAQAPVEEDHRHVVIATPRDIQALTRDEFNNKGKLNDLFACYAVDLPPGSGWIEMPEDSEIFVTNDPCEVAAMVQDSKVLMFDGLNLQEEINDALKQAGQPEIPTSNLVSISDLAIEAGETPGDDVFYLGYQGGACLDLPDHPDKVTPQFAVYWLTESLTFLLGVQEQKRLFSEY